MVYVQEVHLSNTSKISDSLRAALTGACAPLMQRPSGDCLKCDFRKCGPSSMYLEFRVNEADVKSIEIHYVVIVEERSFPCIRHVVFEEGKSNRQRGSVILEGLPKGCTVSSARVRFFRDACPMPSKWSHSFGPWILPVAGRPAAPIVVKTIIGSWLGSASIQVEFDKVSLISRVELRLVMKGKQVYRGCMHLNVSGTAGLIEDLDLKSAAPTDCQSVIIGIQVRGINDYGWGPWKNVEVSLASRSPPVHGVSVQTVECERDNPDVAAVPGGSGGDSVQIVDSEGGNCDGETVLSGPGAAEGCVSIVPEDDPGSFDHCRQVVGPGDAAIEADDHQKIESRDDRMVICDQDSGTSEHEYELEKLGNDKASALKVAKGGVLVTGEPGFALDPMEVDKVRRNESIVPDSDEEQPGSHDISVVISESGHSSGSSDEESSMVY